jgi:hypothetical protein
MTDIGSLTHEQFEACLKQAFVLDAGDDRIVETVLDEVSPKGAINPRSDRRRPFSVIFRAPLEPLLPQQIYTLNNATLGSLSLFLVPIGPDGDSMLYEAVFI